MSLAPAVPSWARDRGVQLGVPTVALVAALDVVARVQLTGGYSLGAMVTSMVSSARATATVGALSVVVALVGGVWADNVGTREWIVRAFICVLIGALATLSASIRERREARLRRLTVIAEAAQRAVLRSTPTAIGTVGVATRYVSATEEAMVGGDLYEVAATPYGVRVIVGDVRGKGLPAVQTAASVLGAFRQAAFVEPDVAALAREIDDVVARLIDDEEFVTAILLELHEDSVRVANCGHHPPLLVDPDGARLLDTGEPTTPIGLHPDPVLVELPWQATARLLLFTDGLVEARDATGAFFPLETEAVVLSARSLDESLEELLARLRAYAGRRLPDDVALVLVENRA